MRTRLENNAHDLAGSTEQVSIVRTADDQRTTNRKTARYKGMSNQLQHKARISIADDSDRDSIYALRHEVYAEELHQHTTTHDRMLSDPLDSFNTYIVAKIDGRLAGFVSITPPGFGRYSIDKYLARESVDLSFDEGLYEMRILTVARPHRGTRLAAGLMYAAGRWAEERGGTRLVAMGRIEVLSIYLKHGFKPLGHQIKSGAVTFELLSASVQQLRTTAERRNALYRKLENEFEWSLPFPFFKPPCCFHGGAFFDAIGTDFETLERKESIVNADVLDAWFPPSPMALHALREHLPWLMRTSPPIQSEGLRRAISRHRGVSEDNILPGAGSSDLIYLAFRQWLNRDSRVLVLDPMYGEYVHILEKVIGCHVDRIVLQRRDRYVVNLEELRAWAALGYDLIVLVNPNNPTGQHVAGHKLKEVLSCVSGSTRVWVDEAYIDYAGAGESLECFAATSENTIVCKTMSKVYALSGMRVAYLCGPLHQLSELAPITPPWAVSLPAQVAAVKALGDSAYYEARYRETRKLRQQLIEGLAGIGVHEIVPGQANFVMFHLEPDQPSAALVASETAKRGVFVRDVSLMGREVGLRALRLTVKDEDANERILATLESVLFGPPPRERLPRFS
jgi:histidinol-phosphate/aromatic aminotransferase/cobyric acid decarboxylase-like protein/GNAT superfamily N-acetyltransferase